MDRWHGLTARAIDHVAVVTTGFRVAADGNGVNPWMMRPDVRCRGVTLETRTTAPADPDWRDTRAAGLGVNNRTRTSRARVRVKNDATLDETRRTQVATRAPCFIRSLPAAARPTTSCLQDSLTVPAIRHAACRGWR